MLFHVQKLPIRSKLLLLPTNLQKATETVFLNDLEPKDRTDTLLNHLILGGEVKVRTSLLKPSMNSLRT